MIDLSLERAARIHRGKKVSAFGSVEFDLWADEGSAVASAVYSTGSANANGESVELEWVDVYWAEFSKNEEGEIIKKGFYKKEEKM
jgi:hypothetical protein